MNEQEEMAVRFDGLIDEPIEVNRALYQAGYLHYDEYQVIHADLSAAWQAMRTAVRRNKGEAVSQPNLFESESEAGAS